MIKANELRISNILKKWSLGVYLDKSITIEDLKEILENLNHDYKPIPLTEEWLVRFGFVRRSMKDWSEGYEKYFQPNKDFSKYGINIFLSHYESEEVYSRNHFAINEYTEETIHAVDFLPMELKYVHQLQNIYFAITGEELEIKY